MLNYRKGLDQIPIYDYVERFWSIKLNANESNIGLPPLVEERIISRISRVPFHRYPNEEYDLLREQIGKSYGYTKDNIIIGNGSSEIIEKVFHAFGGNKNRKAIYSAPSFSMYDIYAKSADMEAIIVPLRNDYTLDINEFLSKIEKNNPSLVVICNPNNPTGQVLSIEEIEYIAQHISCAMLVDEAYAEFYGKSAIPLLEKYTHIMIARTFSKAYALAGCRVGYMLAHKDVIQMIAKTYMPYHMNVLSIIAADTVFQMRDEFDLQIHMICAERIRMQEKYMNLPMLTVYPSNTNFLLLHCSKAKELNNLLNEHGVSVRYFKHTPYLENKLRISIGCPNENDDVYRLIKSFVEGNI
jgi:hypothetical protein